LVPPLLAFAIPFDRFRMLRAVVRKIVGMSFAPLLLAVVGDLTIFRICFELPSVIVGASPALALRSAADDLLWTEGRTKKSTLAVETAAVLGHDDSSEISQDESLRNNQTASDVQILETYLEFVLRPCQRALVDHWPRPTPAIMAPFFTGVNSFQPGLNFGLELLCNYTIESNDQDVSSEVQATCVLMHRVDMYAHLCIY
jgi:hypothetical protein